jgi:hypothetical protein
VAKFCRQSRVTHPAALVLDTMIERMEDIVPFLPSVDAIDLKSREDQPDERIHIVRRWQGSIEQAPRAVRPFLKRETLAWIDDAFWRPADFAVDWTLLTSQAGLYECSGTNRMEPDPREPETTTLMTIEGELRVYPERLPGVPRLIARRLAPTVEAFVIKLIAPNLTEVAKGLQGYLDARSGR